MSYPPPPYRRSSPSTAAARPHDRADGEPAAGPDPANTGSEDGAAVVLNVNDDPIARYAIGRHLRRAGFRVLEASTGRDALRLLGLPVPPADDSAAGRMSAVDKDCGPACDGDGADGAEGTTAAAAGFVPEREVQLVLLDVRLPDISGLEVCRRIKSAPATADIPVLQFSAVLVEPGDRVRGLDGGADGYLSGDCEPEVLAATIRSLLRMRRAERALRDSARRWRSTFDAIADGVALIEPDGRIARCNATLERMLGRAPHEIEGRRAVDVLPPAATSWPAGPMTPSRPPVAGPASADLSPTASPAAASPAAASPGTAARAATFPTEGEWTARLPNPDRRAAPSEALPAACPDGDGNGLGNADSAALDDSVWVRVRVNPLCDDRGLPAGAVAVLADVTAHVRAEARERAVRLEAERANRAKDEFLAVLSHELRTPLTAMTGWLQMMRAGGLSPDEFSRAIEVVCRNTAVQTRLVDDLLDVSRIVTGRMTVETVPTDLAEAVSSAAELIRPTAAAKGIGLTVAPAPKAVRVVGDAARLRQIVWNLLSNAVKFTEPGGRIDLAVIPSEDGRTVSVTVRDNGVGIAADFLPELFRRFHQADGSYSRRHMGLGLGLAIARHLARLHGGDITAASDGPGRGACFTLVLPTAAAAAAAVAARADADPSARVGGLPTGPALANGNGRGYANGNGHPHANGNGNGHPHANGNGNGHPHANGNGNSLARANGHSNGHTQPNGSGHVNGNGHSNGYGNGSGSGNGNGRGRAAAGGRGLDFESGPKPLDGLRVLLIDDNADSRRLLATMLRFSGAAVDVASAASEAVKLVGMARPDVIVSDIGMPDEDGYSLLPKLRAAAGSGSDTSPPAVALTGFATAEDRRRSYQAGFQEHLAKPVDFDDLVKAIAETAKAGRQGQAAAAAATTA